MAQKHPVIYFGTSTFGSSHVPTLQDEAIVSTFLDALNDGDVSQIDTAARYPPDNHGGSERMIGRVKAPARGFTINTKVLFAGQNSDGTLSKEAVRKSVANSLEVLGVKKLGILYAHCPDLATPLAEQAEALNEQYQKGYCEKIGISNFPLDMLKSFIDICEKEGYIKPSVYQGQYNLICREPEKELLPFLREHNMTFNAYSPLGGGFLTGKLTLGTAEGTRLRSAYGAHFAAWYDRPEFHDAVKKLLEVIGPLGIKPSEAALRWLAYHSDLGEKDGVILGATKIEQLKQNLEDMEKGALPQAVVDEIMAIGETIDAMGSGNFDVKPAELPPR
ncbi:Aldo/keto reductase [Annulohypoxylon maeteangense]|uniref:Aldo/keto reductase n=1 Tax=Annulohypoxylon maeteangense TaxID=1927788 RepID=UPI00200828A5|nr:Aldo/keto reductase [Annulohypoxylon maeteangense]KAI0882615.1 Aldo/keto reductase [Annulohypoxylon maeteangense]